MIGSMFGQDTGGGDDLENRKQRLLQFLHQNGAQRPYGAQPLFGAGRSSHGGSDFPHSALPSLSYNPFLSQIAGRGENFPQLPNGIDRITAGNVQGNAPSVLGGVPSDAYNTMPIAPRDPRVDTMPIDPRGPTAGTDPTAGTMPIDPRGSLSGGGSYNTMPIAPPANAPTGSTMPFAPRNMFPASPYVNPVLRDLTSNYYQPTYSGNMHYAV